MTTVASNINITIPWIDTKSLSYEGTSPSQNQSQRSIKDTVYNGTGYYIEDDEGDTGLTDLQTLFLACFATLIPLVISLLTAFGIRILWTRYKRRKENMHYDGILHREGTSESMSRPLHSHLLSDKSCGDTHLALNSDDVEVCDGTHLVGQNRSNNTNGSIITMTLKNNHLIVETEERNDIEEDSRETTMKYSPNARDGVFVVEVQQGVRRSPGSGGVPSFKEPETSVSVSDQCALVHNPPERYSDEETLEEGDDSEYFMDITTPERSTPGLSMETKTGLCQSDTSLSSLQNTYCYTKQQCYDHGSYGYNVYGGYVVDEPQKRLSDDRRPKIMSAIYKTSFRSDSVDAAFTMNGLRDERILEEFIPEEENTVFESFSKKTKDICAGSKVVKDVTSRNSCKVEGEVK